MIRGGTSLGRMARSLALCAAALALALAVPASAGAQSAVDEYTLDIPSSGNNAGGDAGVSAAGAGASGGGGGSNGPGGGPGGSGGSGAGPGSDGQGADPDGAGLGPLGGGGTSDVDPGSRSAPAVVADTLADSAMLPVIAVLLLITGLGAWRALRARRMLTGEPD